MEIWVFIPLVDCELGASVSYEGVDSGGLYSTRLGVFVALRE